MRILGALVCAGVSIDKLIEWAHENSLADQVLGQSLDELAPPSRTLLKAVFELVKAMAKDKQCPVNEVYFTRRLIREHTGWNDWQIKAHIKQLEELEYLYVRIGSRGKEYAYALNYRGQGIEGGKCYLNLTPVDEIKKLIKKKKGD